MNQPKIAIIGCGGIGSWHLSHLVTFDDIQLAGFCDLIPERAEKFAETAGGGRTYTEVNLLDREGRIAELARMYGGDNVTQSTLASADEQLTLSERFKSSLSLTGE